MVPTVPPTKEDVLNGTENLLFGLPEWAWIVIGGIIVVVIIAQIINSLPFKKLFFALLFFVIIVVVFGDGSG